MSIFSAPVSKTNMLLLTDSSHKHTQIKMSEFENNNNNNSLMKINWKKNENGRSDSENATRVSFNFLRFCLWDIQRARANIAIFQIKYTNNDNGIFCALQRAHTVQNIFALPVFIKFAGYSRFVCLFFNHFNSSFFSAPLKCIRAEQALELHDGGVCLAFVFVDIEHQYHRSFDRSEPCSNDKFECKILSKTLPRKWEKRERVEGGR